MLWAMLQLMLRWLKASLAAPNTTISSGQNARSSATAASKPCMLGVSTEYRTPGLRVMPAITCALSAIWGTHLGLT
jgi:hypothetical protein